MKNIVLLSSVFAIMSSSVVMGSDAFKGPSYEDGEKEREGEHYPSKATFDRDIIVRNLKVVQNPLFGVELPRRRSGSLLEADSSSAHGDEYDREESQSGSLDGEEKPCSRVPLLRLSSEEKKLSFGNVAKVAREELDKREKIQSYRNGVYKGLLGKTSPTKKSFAEKLRDERETAELERELKSIKVDPKDPRFKELFLDSEAPHGLNIENINRRRELVRGGAGVSGGGDDFSNFLILLQGFFGTIAREEDEIKILKALIVKAKKYDVAAKKQEIREPADIELELRRTKKRLEGYKVSKDCTLRKLAIATGVSLSKLRKLPPIAPERRSLPNAHWD
ncbi:MAG TPA: hypothetical protein DD412_05375 [Holosporales bacterium]|nr:hypothetical protein [Holosporales bacterium]